MVRLVFRPYTQIRQSICTSEQLRSSIRLSPDFNLFKYSSPPFGSHHLRSRSTPNYEVMTPAHGAAVTSLPRQSLSLRVWVFHPITRATGGLLGPCFKTGRFETTFMHQSFAPKQHLPAKSIHIKSHRSDFPLCLPMTSIAPTRRRRSIPHSLEPR